MITYSEYINKGIELINTIINNSNYCYDNFAYNENEGRWNSIKGEGDFIENIITQEWKKVDANNTLYYFYNEKLDILLVVPHSARSWFDIGIIKDHLFFPINIKISNGNTADNLFGVKVLNYLLFGEYNTDNYGVHLPGTQDETKIAENLSNFYFQKVITDFESFFNTQNIRDYFFISINKLDNSIKILPFLNIEKDFIKTNPKNAFQINLSLVNNSLSQKELDFNENIEKLIHKYFEYIEKKAQPYLYLEKVIKAAYHKVL